MGYPKVRKSYYDAPEGQVHYRYLLAAKKDETKAPILLFHQSACSSVYYKEMIQRLSAEGHDVYAPDMPGFGASYKPITEPTTVGVKYYADVFMVLIEQLNISKFHAFGHHSGASIALEIATQWPEKVLSLTCCGLALMTPEEQQHFIDTKAVMYNKPVEDGSHFKKVWDILDSQAPWDLVEKHYQTLDACRAFIGRIQCYTCVNRQPVFEVVKKVKGPFLMMASKEDVLYSYMARVKELKPDTSIVEVKGQDFEVMRDAPGVAKALMDFYANI